MDTPLTSQSSHSAPSAIATPTSTELKADLSVSHNMDCSLTSGTQPAYSDLLSSERVDIDSIKLEFFKSYCKSRLQDRGIDSSSSSITELKKKFSRTFEPKVKAKKLPLKQLAEKFRPGPKRYFAKRTSVKKRKFLPDILKDSDFVNITTEEEQEDLKLKLCRPSLTNVVKTSEIKQPVQKPPCPKTYGKPPTPTLSKIVTTTKPVKDSVSVTVKKDAHGVSHRPDSNKSPIIKSIDKTIGKKLTLATGRSKTKSMDSPSSPLPLQLTGDSISKPIAPTGYPNMKSSYVDSSKSDVGLMSKTANSGSQINRDLSVDRKEDKSKSDVKKISLEQYLQNKGLDGKMLLKKQSIKSNEKTSSSNHGSATANKMPLPNIAQKPTKGILKGAPSKGNDIAVSQPKIQDVAKPIGIETKPSPINDSEKAKTATSDSSSGSGPKSSVTEQVQHAFETLCRVIRPDPAMAASYAATKASQNTSDAAAIVTILEPKKTVTKGVRESPLSAMQALTTPSSRVKEKEKDKGDTKSLVTGGKCPPDITRAIKSNEAVRDVVLNVIKTVKQSIEAKASSTPSSNRSQLSKTLKLQPSKDRVDVNNKNESTAEKSLTMSPKTDTSSIKDNLHSEIRAHDSNAGYSIAEDLLEPLEVESLWSDSDDQTEPTNEDSQQYSDVKTSVTSVPKDACSSDIVAKEIDSKSEESSLKDIKQDQSSDIVDNKQTELSNKNEVQVPEDSPTVGQTSDATAEIKNVDVSVKDVVDGEEDDIEDGDIDDEQDYMEPGDNDFYMKEENGMSPTEDDNASGHDSSTLPSSRPKREKKINRSKDFDYTDNYIHRNTFRTLMKQFKEENKRTSVNMNRKKLETYSRANIIKKRKQRLEENKSSDESKVSTTPKHSITNDSGDEGSDSTVITGQMSPRASQHSAEEVSSRKSIDEDVKPHISTDEPEPSTSSAQKDHNSPKSTAIRRLLKLKPMANRLEEPLTKPEEKKPESVKKRRRSAPRGPSVIKRHRSSRGKAQVTKPTRVKIKKENPEEKYKDIAVWEKTSALDEKQDVDAMMDVLDMPTIRRPKCRVLHHKKAKRNVSPKADEPTFAPEEEHAPKESEEVIDLSERPPTPHAADDGNEENNAVEEEVRMPTISSPRRRGRPSRKKKRGRGRPRRNFVIDTSDIDSSDVANASGLEMSPVPVPRKPKEKPKPDAYPTQEDYGDSDHEIADTAFDDADDEDNAADESLYPEGKQSESETVGVEYGEDVESGSVHKSPLPSPSFATADNLYSNGEDNDDDDSYPQNVMEGVDEQPMLDESDIEEEPVMNQEDASTAIGNSTLPEDRADMSSALGCATLTNDITEAQSVTLAKGLPDASAAAMANDADDLQSVTVKKDVIGVHTVEMEKNDPEVPSAEVVNDSEVPPIEMQKDVSSVDVTNDDLEEVVNNVQKAEVENNNCESLLNISADTQPASPHSKVAVPAESPSVNDIDQRTLDNKEHEQSQAVVNHDVSEKNEIPIVSQPAEKDIVTDDMDKEESVLTPDQVDDDATEAVISQKVDSIVSPVAKSEMKKPVVVLNEMEEVEISTLHVGNLISHEDEKIDSSNCEVVEENIHHSENVSEGINEATCAVIMEPSLQNESVSKELLSSELLSDNECQSNEMTPLESTTEDKSADKETASDNTAIGEMADISERSDSQGTTAMEPSTEENLQSITSSIQGKEAMKLDEAVPVMSQPAGNTISPEQTEMVEKMNDVSSIIRPETEISVQPTQGKDSAEVENESIEGDNEKCGKPNDTVPVVEESSVPSPTTDTVNDILETSKHAESIKEPEDVGENVVTAEHDESTNEPEPIGENTEPSTHYESTKEPEPIETSEHYENAKEPDGVEINENSERDESTKETEPVSESTEIAEHYESTKEKCSSENMSSIEDQTPVEGNATAPLLHEEDQTDAVTNESSNIVNHLPANLVEPDAKSIPDAGIPRDMTLKRSAPTTPVSQAVSVLGEDTSQPAKVPRIEDHRAEENSSPNAVTSLAAVPVSASAAMSTSHTINPTPSSVHPAVVSAVVSIPQTTLTSSSKTQSSSAAQMKRVEDKIQQLVKQAELSSAAASGGSDTVSKDRNPKELRLQQEYVKIWNKLMKLQEMEKVKEKEGMQLASMKEKAANLLRLIKDQIHLVREKETSIPNTQSKEAAPEIIVAKILPEVQDKAEAKKPEQPKAPLERKPPNAHAHKPSSLKRKMSSLSRTSSAESRDQDGYESPDLTHHSPFTGHPKPLSVPLHIANPYCQRKEELPPPESEQKLKENKLGRPQNAHSHQTIAKFVISTGPSQAHQAKNPINFTSITNMYCKYTDPRSMTPGPASNKQYPSVQKKEDGPLSRPESTPAPPQVSTIGNAVPYGPMSGTQATNLISQGNAKPTSTIPIPGPNSFGHDSQSGRGTPISRPSSAMNLMTNRDPEPKSSVIAPPKAKRQRTVADRLREVRTTNPSQLTTLSAAVPQATIAIQTPPSIVSSHVRGVGAPPQSAPLITSQVRASGLLGPTPLPQVIATQARPHMAPPKLTQSTASQSAVQQAQMTAASHTPVFTTLVSSQQAVAAQQQIPGIAAVVTNPIPAIPLVPLSGQPGTAIPAIIAPGIVPASVPQALLNFQHFHQYQLQQQMQLRQQQVQTAQADQQKQAVTLQKPVQQAVPKTPALGPESVRTTVVTIPLPSQVTASHQSKTATKPMVPPPAHQPSSRPPSAAPAGPSTAHQSLRPPSVAPGSSGSTTSVSAKISSSSAASKTGTRLVCDVCANKACFLCSGCKSVSYCSQMCQMRAWPNHSVTCNK